jgi:rhodanese-related sulfurtransferase
MGDTAAQTLVDLGYTRVFNLEGGYIAWRAAGLPFVE